MYFDGIRVPFFLEERDCSLTPKAEAPPGTRGRFGRIPFKEDPNNALCPARAADQGRRYRQKRARTNRRKKERSARGGMPEKNAETCPGQHGTYLPAAAGKSMPMPPCVAGEYERRKIYRNRPIRPVMRMMTGTLFSLFRQP
jgi:hypothetical protein